MSKDEFVSLPDEMFPATESEFDWTVPVHLGRDSLVVSSHTATNMNDAALRESLTTLQIEFDYRALADRIKPPDGYYIVRDGESQEGDLKLNTLDPATWEPAADGSAYWSFNLLARPETA